MEGFIGFLDEALELLISLVSRSCPWYVAEVNTLSQILDLSTFVNEYIRTLHYSNAFQS